MYSRYLTNSVQILYNNLPEGYDPLFYFIIIIVVHSIFSWGIYVYLNYMNDYHYILCRAKNKTFGLKNISDTMTKNNRRQYYARQDKRLINIKSL